MKQLRNFGWKRVGGLFAAGAVLLCASEALLANDGVLAANSSSHATLHPEQALIPFSPANQGNNFGLAFDLGGSETPKLKLELNAGSGDSTASFRSLGSVHCEDGVLSLDSYRATNCHFVDGAAVNRAESVALGSHFRLSEQATAGVRIYQAEHHLNAPRLNGQINFPQSDVLAPKATFIEHLFPSLAFGQEVGAMDSALTGVDIDFQLALGQDTSGEVVLGLQLSRVLDGSASMLAYSQPTLTQWHLTDPVDAARLSFDWYRGAFSAGVQSYYRGPVNLIGREDLDSLATFDVHFTWQAPWSASLSVGASNLLGAGASDQGTKKSSLPDSMESIYGRIPYVRYKQDL